MRKEVDFLQMNPEWIRKPKKVEIGDGKVVITT